MKTEKQHSVILWTKHKWWGELKVERCLYMWMRRLLRNLKRNIKGVKKTCKLDLDIFRILSNNSKKKKLNILLVEKHHHFQGWQQRSRLAGEKKKIMTRIIWHLILQEKIMIVCIILFVGFWGFLGFFPGMKDSKLLGHQQKKKNPLWMF